MAMKVKTEVSKYGTKTLDIHYGKDSEQTGDLYIPHSEIKATICLFHGGFWKVQYDRHQLDSICERLLACGYAIWNVEYRRTGVLGRQWQEPFEDAISAVNFLSQVTVANINVDHIYVVGHSAGGQLSVWLGNHEHTSVFGSLQVQPCAVIGLAPVLDLHECFDRHSGDGAVNALLQATPDENPNRYESTSPMRLNRMKIPTILIHGVEDDYLPIETARRFFDKFNEGGANLALYEVDGGDHMDFLDPSSVSVNTLIEVLNEHSENYVTHYTN